ncbi:MAG: YceK/YidQ family lipoprotein [Lacunisphaera sp.]
MKSHTVRIVTLTLFTIAASGCASIGARQGAQEHKPYQGVNDDVHYLANPSEADHPSLQWLNIIDLPFSAVLDTILLPFDLAGKHDGDQIAPQPIKSPETTSGK